MANKGVLGHHRQHEAVDPRSVLHKKDQYVFWLAGTYAPRTHCSNTNHEA